MRVSRSDWTPMLAHDARAAPLPVSTHGGGSRSWAGASSAICGSPPDNGTGGTDTAAAFPERFDEAPAVSAGIAAGI